MGDPSQDTVILTEHLRWEELVVLAIRWQCLESRNSIVV